MKKTKLTATILAGALCMAALCGCTGAGGSKSSKKDNDKDGDEETTKVTEPVETTSAPQPLPDVELPEDEVILKEISNNYAEGYQCSCTYVMSDGSVYMSCEYFGGYSADWDYEFTDEDRLSVLKFFTHPVAQIDEDTLLEMYQNIVMIDPDADFFYEDDICFDAGYSGLEANVNGQWVKIAEGGVYYGWLEDDYATEVRSLLQQFMATIDLSCTTHVYSKDITYINTFDCTESEPKPGRMLITNMDELKEFEEMTGIDLESLENFEYFGNEDYDAFNSMCIAVQIIKTDMKRDLDSEDGLVFLVSDSYVGFAPDTGMTISARDAYGPDFYYYCSVAQLPAYDLSQYDAFFDYADVLLGG